MRSGEERRDADGGGLGVDVLLGHADVGAAAEQLVWEEFGGEVGERHAVEGLGEAGLRGVGDVAGEPVKLQLGGQEVLAEGGIFVTKVFKGGMESSLLADVKKHFQKVVHAKPDASREGSPEEYLVAIGFRK